MAIDALSELRSLILAGAHAAHLCRLEGYGLMCDKHAFHDPAEVSDRLVKFADALVPDVESPLSRPWEE